MIDFISFRLLNESLNSKFDVSRNADLENAVNLNFPTKLFSAHTKAMQSPHMKVVGIYVLRFMGKPLKQIEYHIHNDNAYPGTKTEPDRKAMLHAIKIIHDDAADQLVNHNRSVYIHAANSDQYSKYLQLGRRLAISNNRRLKELGDQPYTTNPTQRGPAFIIREESGYIDMIGRKFIHIEEQLIAHNKMMYNESTDTTVRLQTMREEDRRN